MSENEYISKLRAARQKLVQDRRTNVDILLNSTNAAAYTYGPVLKTIQEGIAAIDAAIEDERNQDGAPGMIDKNVLG